MRERNSIPEALRVPPVFNMGFHYTVQYSRRARINVMGLVDQSSPAWERWYRLAHEFESCRRIAATGYKLIEIHFLYGFGLRGEREEYELTKKMVDNAHRAGLKVMGYFQFFSVQSETFLPENPWAADCLQLDENGKKRQYAYNRDALCFSHEKVRQYYLEGIQLGLEYCGLDGIRLDNTYNKTCYCDNCQKLFKRYLRDTFDEQNARRIFGFYPLTGCNLAPAAAPSDPLWQATTDFEVERMNDMMRLLRGQVKRVNPEAIFGGNPAIYRSPDEIAAVNHVYPPELGMSHDLVCSENPLFPARTGDSVRHQALAYKTGQANGFKVYGCHHQHRGGALRWPESAAECALSMFEALAFGGHVPVTVWGIRMDGDESKTLYERPEYLEATRDVAGFIAEHGELFRDAASEARLGVYVNRSSMSFDYDHCWYSLQGLFQIFLKRHILFRMVDTDDPGKMDGLDVLIVADVRLVSDMMLNAFADFVGHGGKLIMTGEACRFDEFMLTRESDGLRALLDHPSVRRLNGAPEACDKRNARFGAPDGPVLPYPEKADEFLAALAAAPRDDFTIDAPDFVAVDSWRNAAGRKVISVLNYDNANPADVVVTLPTGACDVHVRSPRLFGVASVETRPPLVTLSRLSTMALIEFRVAETRRSDEL